ICGLFGQNQLDRDLDEELKVHLEMLVEENIRRGMALKEARLAARRSFGGVEQIREAYRDQRGLPIVETLLQDIRFGFRMLRKNPSFTAVAVLTLALGIGANAAIFSVLDAVLLQMLPVHDPQQLVLVRWTAKDWPAIVEDLEGSNRKDPNGGWLSESVPFPIYDAMRTENTTCSELFAFAANITGSNVQIEGKPHSAASEAVSGSYFSGLGVQTFLGRPILPDDDLPAAPAVAVLSHSFWKNKLGGDSSVVGKTIAMNSIPFTVAGVAPPGFTGTQPGEDVEVWVTLHMFPRLMQALDFGGPLQPGGDAAAAASAYWEKPGTWWLVVMGRVKNGVSEPQVRAELDGIFNQRIDSMITSEKAQENRPSLNLAPGNKGLDRLRRQFSEPLFVLMGAVGLVLLIACANVAGLLLARATARQREIAVRLSLGAKRMRLIKQLLTESLLLAALGGALGLLIARWFSQLLVALVGSGRQSIELPLEVNWRVLLFTAVVAIITGILFGLAPAFSTTRISLTAALKEGGGGSRLGARRSGLAKALVSAQVALSLVLLVGAGLFLRTLRELENVPLGFERQQVILFSVAPGLNGYTGARLIEYYRQMRDRVAAIPGVSAVTFSAHGPIGDGSSSSSIRIPGVTTGKELFDLYRHLIGPGYFETLGIPVLRGRVLDESDNATGPQVAVVNQALARKAFGEENPLGKILRFGSEKKPRDFQIVGVVGDAKYSDLREDAPPTAYFSHLQAINSASYMTFQVRTSGDPETVVASLRNEVAEVDANIPITKIDTLVQRIDKALLLERMFSRLIASFGVLALILVCVGLYGTMSYFVARRTNEIGIRMALGARPSTVFRMVLVEGLVLTGAGVVAGLAGAAFGTRLISSVLFGVPALDVLTYASVAALLVGVGLFACYVPARRAMKVDPMVALRYE
ncbi:MAG: ABC transporter permease, partial [Blastocatellia bacterium]